METDETVKIQTYREKKRSLKQIIEDEMKKNYEIDI